jgi:hypothetical protein
MSWADLHTDVDIRSPKRDDPRVFQYPAGPAQSADYSLSGDGSSAGRRRAQIVHLGSAPDRGGRKSRDPGSRRAPGTSTGCATKPPRSLVRPPTQVLVRQLSLASPRFSGVTRHRDGECGVRSLQAEAGRGRLPGDVQATCGACDGGYRKFYCERYAAVRGDGWPRPVVQRIYLGELVAGAAGGTGAIGADGIARRARCRQGYRRIGGVSQGNDESQQLSRCDSGWVALGGGPQRSERRWPGHRRAGYYRTWLNGAGDHA